MKNLSSHLVTHPGIRGTHLPRKTGYPSAHPPRNPGYPPTPENRVPTYPGIRGASYPYQFTVLICTTPRAQRGPEATMPANHTGASPSGRRLARFALGTPLRGWSPLKKPDRSNTNPNGGNNMTDEAKKLLARVTTISLVAEVAMMEKEKRPGHQAHGCFGTAMPPV